MVIDSAPIPPDTKVVANGGVASTSLGDRLALLDLSQSAYYSMNPVAAAVWEQLATPRTPGELAATVRARFEVGDADVDGDVAAVLADLLRLNLIRLADA